MSTFTRLERIVQEELVTCPQELQQKGLEELTNWLGNPDSHGYCRELRTRIRETLDPPLRSTAMQALRRIHQRFLAESHSQAREEVENRRSTEVMRTELVQGYRLIKELGRGVVSFGSARARPGERWYDLSREFSRECAMLLSSTMWSGAGPGLMQSTLEGGNESGVTIAGIKIHLENGQSKFEQKTTPVLPPENVVQCGFFGPRKVLLVDAGMRQREEDRTAFVFFPGGFGTLDELFEVLTLKQLNKLGTSHPIPILLMNYDDHFSGTLQQVQDNVKMGTLNPEDLELFHVCGTNAQGLDALADHYGIPEEQRTYRGTLIDMDTLPPQPPMDPNGRKVEPQ